MDVTKPYEFIWFGDVHGPKPYEFIGLRWAFISQTPVEPETWVWTAISNGRPSLGCTHFRPRSGLRLSAPHCNQNVDALWALIKITIFYFCWGSKTPSKAPPRGPESTPRAQERGLSRNVKHEKPYNLLRNTVGALIQKPIRLGHGP